MADKHPHKPVSSWTLLWQAMDSRRTSWLEGRLMRPSIEEPSTPSARTPPPLALTWPAAVFGLLFGVTMTYAPYEFHTAYFRPLYPYVRAMGMSYLASSI